VGFGVTNDPAIRSVLRADLAARFPGAIILDELGLEYGASRVDVAVVDQDGLHGFEIKSPVDSLDRLPRQVTGYGRVLDTVTLVSAADHVDEAARIIPAWWGLWVVDGQGLKETRPAGRNPAPDPRAIARLLWREEAENLVRRATHAPGLSRLRKEVLQERLVGLVALEELRRMVREALVARPKWVAKHGAEVQA
jgi:hypothetical protein